MKTNEVKVGSTYSVKVSDKVVPVRIVEEKWTGDKHTGWIGMNTLTNRPVRIKSAAKLRAELNGVHPAAEPDGHSEQLDPDDKPPATPAEKPAKAPKGGKKEKAPKPEKAKKVSGLDAAAAVLKKAGKPMGFKEITEKVLAAGWKTNGKTPAATLYAAAIREIAAKGRESRFRKTDRGLFEHTGADAGKEG